MTVTNKKIPWAGVVTQGIALRGSTDVNKKVHFLSEVTVDCTRSYKVQNPCPDSTLQVPVSMRRNRLELIVLNIHSGRRVNPIPGKLCKV